MKTDHQMIFHTVQKVLMVYRGDKHLILCRNECSQELTIYCTWTILYSLSRLYVRVHFKIFCLSIILFNNVKKIQPRLKPSDLAKFHSLVTSVSLRNLAQNECSKQTKPKEKNLVLLWLVLSKSHSILLSRNQFLLCPPGIK